MMQLSLFLGYKLHVVPLPSLKNAVFSTPSFNNDIEHIFGIINPK